MKIHSGHLTVLVVFLALLGTVHLHKTDFIQLAQGTHQVQQQETAVADLHVVPNPLRSDNQNVVEHSSQCIWPDEPANETFVRQLIRTDGTVTQVQEPVWRQTIHVPRAISTIEIVDSAGTRWKLISGEATKGAPLTGRIQREAGETFFIHEDNRVCFGKWQLVR